MTNARLRSIDRIAIVAAALLVQPSVQGAQPPASPPAPRNLQVFPKDIKIEQLIAEMDGFAMGLGVGCDHCHAPARLPPGVILPPGQENLDFALDDKPAKKAARQMMVMLRTINAMVPAAVGKPAEQAALVQCATCHSGMVTPPLPLATILDKTTAEKGRDAAVAQYKELRQSYYGSSAYDFSESRVNGASLRLGGLDGYAVRLTNTGKPADALAWFALNLEYFPQSAITWALIGNAQIQNRNKTAALEAINKSIELSKPVFGGTLPAGHPLETLKKQAEAMP